MIHFRPQFTGLFIKIWEGTGNCLGDIVFTRYQRTGAKTAGSRFLVFALHSREQLKKYSNRRRSMGLYHKCWRTTSCLLRAGGRTNEGKLDQVLKSFSPQRRHVFCWNVQPRCGQAAFHWTGCKVKSAYYIEIAWTPCSRKIFHGCIRERTESRLPPRLCFSPRVEHNPEVPQNCPLWIYSSRKVDGKLSLLGCDGFLREWNF